MKAMISTSYGGPEILDLQEVATPLPQPNEIRVKIHATTVSRANTMMRTGKPYIGRLFMGLKKPKHPISGTNFAGIVEAIGTNVSKFKIGDKVFGENIETFGAYAEYLCVDEKGIVALIPDGVDYKEAAGVCDGALTSMNFLRNVGQLKKGQRILINGASGSLGTAAVQLAKKMGGVVTGVCSAKNIELVKSLGADNVVDYNEIDFAKTGLKFDIIYDTVGTRTFADSKAALAKNGTFISPVLGFPLLMDVVKTSIGGNKKAKFSATGMLPLEEQKELFSELMTYINQDDYHFIIDRIYSLEQIPQAHWYVDTGRKRGDVVISVN